MVPIYAIVSVFSYLWYWYAVYWEVIRDCYEAFAIASFFSLMCHYIEPDLHRQKEHFRNLTPKPWPWPVTWLKRCWGGDRIWRVPANGLTWFNIVWIGVFQYCAIRPLMTFVAVATQLTGRYCESSLNPVFAHVWVMIIEAVAVTFAMYFLIAFYITTKDELATHKPFFKLLCIKLVIFFSFWQTVGTSRATYLSDS